MSLGKENIIDGQFEYSKIEKKCDLKNILSGETEAPPLKTKHISFPEFLFETWQSRLRPVTFCTLLNIYNLIRKNNFQDLDITLKDMQNISYLSKQTLIKSMKELEIFKLINRHKANKNQLGVSYTFSLDEKLKPQESL